MTTNRATIRAAAREHGWAIESRWQVHSGFSYLVITRATTLSPRAVLEAYFWPDDGDRLESAWCGEGIGDERLDEPLLDNVLHYLQTYGAKP